MINDNSAPFLGGFAMGSWGSISLWDSMAVYLQVTNLQILEYYAFKVLGTLVLGLVGGFAGMIAKDLYRYIKIKLTKNR